MNNPNEKQKHIGALDVCILLAVLACAVSLGFRFYATRRSEVKNDVPLENYIVSFVISDIKDSSAKNYLKEGTRFYLKESGELLGTLREGLTVSDALKHYEMPDGQIVSVLNSATGDLYRVDVEGSMDVQGKTDASGRFLLDGNRSLSANKEVEIYSKYLAVTVRITDIAKAQ